MISFFVKTLPKIANFIPILTNKSITLKPIYSIIDCTKSKIYNVAKIATPNIKEKFDHINFLISQPFINKRKLPDIIDIKIKFSKIFINM